MSRLLLMQCHERNCNRTFARIAMIGNGRFHPHVVVWFYPRVRPEGGGSRGWKKPASVPPSRSPLQKLRGATCGNRARAFCGNFIRDPRGNIMIRHSIRAVGRISASLAAGRDRRIAKSAVKPCAGAPGCRHARRQARFAGKDSPDAGHMQKLLPHPVEDLAADERRMHDPLAVSAK